MSDRELAARAVRAGAAAAVAVAGDALAVTRKSVPTDLVSAADRASERAIVELLRAQRPGDAVTGEEGAEAGPPGAGRRWLVDGLDGTVNFLRGLPQWCVAVVLVADGAPVACAVLDPVHGQLFDAAAGEGATCDGTALRVREGAPLDAAVVSTFLRPDKLRGADAAAAFGPLIASAGMLRMGGAGSLELAWLAAGRLDGWTQPNVDDWDWLPGRLLVEEAGGRTGIVAGTMTWHVAAAPGTFEALAALMGGS
jgi:myo-inositol-1(or 4)-monophosphatase